MELLYYIKEFREKELDRINKKLKNEKYIREREKQKHNIKESWLDEFCNISYNSCKNTIDYFDLPTQMSLFEKTNKRKICFPRQLSHYSIVEGCNDKGMDNYYYSWAGRLFHTKHSTIMYSAEKISDKKSLLIPEGKEVLDALNFIKKKNHKNYFSNGEKSESNTFFADSYNVCKKIAEHLKVPLKEIFKSGSLENKLCIYKIMEKNEDNFNDDFLFLISELFNQKDSSIKEAYDKISETNISTPEGRKIVEVLNLF